VIGGEEKIRRLVRNDRETVVRKAGSWKGSAVQRGLERRSKEISMVRSRYQETSNGDCNRVRTLFCVPL
jgi:hypothetical protein